MKWIYGMLFLPLALVLVGCPRPIGPVAPDYTVEQVSLDYIEPDASALNNAGEVAGSILDAEEVYMAAVWSDGDIATLADPEGTVARATAISGNGAVAGTSRELELDFHPGELITLWTYGTPGVADGPHGLNQAYAVNNYFEVVGATFDEEWENPSPLLWTPLDLKLNPKPLQTFDDLGGVAYDINDAGIAVGYSRYNTNPLDATAVLWDTRGIQEIGGLGGNFSTATAINDFNEVVGYSTLADGPSDVTRGWLYNGNNIVELETLGGASSAARDINNSRVIVGWSTDDEGNKRATLWLYSFRQGRYVAIDLNDQVEEGLLGAPTWEDALDINNAGQIVVQGRLLNDAVVYGLLTP